MWGAAVGAGMGSMANQYIDSPTSKTNQALKRKEGSIQEMLKNYEKMYGKGANPANRMDPNKRIFGSYRGQFSDTNYLSNTALGGHKNQIARIFRKNSQ